MPTLSNKQRSDPERLGRMSMSGLKLEDALRGALQVKPPLAPKRKPRKARKRKSRP